MALEKLCDFKLMNRTKLPFFIPLSLLKFSKGKHTGDYNELEASQRVNEFRLKFQGKCNAILNIYYVTFSMGEWKLRVSQTKDTHGCQLYASEG